MKEKIKDLFREIDELKVDSKEHVEQLRIKYLSKKGALSDLFADFKNVAPEQRKEVGQMLNNLKNHIQEKIEHLRDEYTQKEETGKEHPDLSLPADFMETGSRHPLSIVRNQIVDIFSHIGYTVFEGPEIENDWHNFSALNFPEEHPARDMQDTFFIEKSDEPSKDIVLRTHTSSVQVRMMETHKPPIRAIFPGRVYRNEAISARSHCIFHQVEGLYIDKDVSFADLKQTLLYFAKEMFSPETKIRLRPSYFPFTEPSAEMDISCNICGGKGCNICKYSGWVEILGCGMVDPNVLENCGIDSKIYSGFAFGMGIERMTLVKYNIKDIRLYFENDLRFLKQFASVI